MWTLCSFSFPYFIFLFLSYQIIIYFPQLFINSVNENLNNKNYQKIFKKYQVIFKKFNVCLQVNNVNMLIKLKQHRPCYNHKQRTYALSFFLGYIYIYIYILIRLKINRRIGIYDDNLLLNMWLFLVLKKEFIIINKKRNYRRLMIHKEDFKSKLLIMKLNIMKY